MTFYPKDLDTLHAYYLLGVASLGDIYDFAIRELREPVDDNLLAISICDKSDEECIRREALSLFEDRGLCDAPTREVLRTFATDVSSRILDGSLPARAGADLIVRAVRRADLHDFHELDAFRYAASEMDDRPEDFDFFQNALIEEAQRWASGANEG